MSKKPKKFGKKEKTYSDKIFKILSKNSNKTYTFKDMK